jgi:hypothetical protein
VSPQEKYLSDLDPATEKNIHSHFQLHTIPHPSIAENKNICDFTFKIHRKCNASIEAYTGRTGDNKPYAV